MDSCTGFRSIFGASVYSFARTTPPCVCTPEAEASGNFRERHFVPRGRGRFTSNIFGVKGFGRAGPLGRNVADGTNVITTPRADRYAINDDLISKIEFNPNVVRNSSNSDSRRRHRRRQFYVDNYLVFNAASEDDGISWTHF